MLGTLIAAILVSLFVKTFLIQAFLIPSGSMEPTLHGCPGCIIDRMLVSKPATRLGGVHRGDIVVFHGSSGWLFRTFSTNRSELQDRVHDTLAMIGLAASSNEGDLIKRVSESGPTPSKVKTATSTSAADRSMSPTSSRRQSQRDRLPGDRARQHAVGDG